ncbi:hypothetical protein LEMLEM_LOCUS11486 [Lemmus lemmus]
MPEPREGLELCHQEGGAEMKNLTHSAQLCEATPSATSHTTPKERTPARRCPVSAPLFHDVTGSSPSPRQKQAARKPSLSVFSSGPSRDQHKRLSACQQSAQGSLEAAPGLLRLHSERELLGL